MATVNVCFGDIRRLVGEQRMWLLNRGRKVAKRCGRTMYALISMSNSI